MLDHQSVQVALSLRIFDAEITIMVQGTGMELVTITMGSPYRGRVIDAVRERTRSVPNNIEGFGEHGPGRRASGQVDPDGSKIKNLVLPILIGADISYVETLEEPV